MFFKKAGKDLNLISFKSHAVKLDRATKAVNTSPCFKSISKNADRLELVKKKMMLDYLKLSTPEQRLYAACTSWSTILKHNISKELASLNQERQLEVLSKVDSVLDELGLHGLKIHSMEIRRNIGLSA